MDSDTPVTSVTASRILLAIRIFVIVLAALLITLITYDALTNVSFISNERYLRAQFWICILFILSIVAEIAVKRRFTTWQWVSHILFLAICVPYLSVIVHYDIQVSPRVHYFLRFVPVIRAVYALSIVTGAMSKAGLKAFLQLHDDTRSVAVLRQHDVFYSKNTPSTLPSPTTGVPFTGRVWTSRHAAVPSTPSRL